MDRFRSRFGTDPEFVSHAPGRVNLIGEHTDYNDGFVLPMALTLRTSVAARRRLDSRVVCEAADLDDVASFDALEPPSATGAWFDYVGGVAWSLRSDGHAIRGWEGVVASDVPRGSGLSSSAALELAVAQVFATAGDLRWDPVAMALASQRAENEWVGVNSGVMDQLISSAAVEGAALLIDCRSLDISPVVLSDDVSVVILDTGTRRSLVGSEYNDRRASCLAAAEHLGVAALRDADPAMLESGRTGLDDVTYRRARHIVTENQRVLDAVAASADPVRFGQLMNESHVSLRDDFEVSSPALDVMVESAWSEGCFGSRLTGAGFAGAAVALVAHDRVDEFTRAVGGRYREQTGHQPWIFPTGAGPGATTDLFERTDADD